MNTFTQKSKATQSEICERQPPNQFGHNPEVRSMLHLQRSFSGNQRYSRIHGSPRQPISNKTGDYVIPDNSDTGKRPLLVQAKLTLGKSGDRYEEEADRLADRIVNGSNGATVAAGNVSEQNGQVPVGIGSVHPKHEALIGSRLGLGRPLSQAQRGFFEPRLGRDLSETRIHADSYGAELAEGLGARALTVGQDIFFGAGESASARETGSSLLAHELVHVAQQNQAPASLVQRAETDDTLSQHGTIADGASLLNAYVNQQIGNAINAAASPRGRSTLPRQMTPMNVVAEAYQRLGARFVSQHLTVVGNWAYFNLTTSSVGIGGYLPISHRYFGATGNYLNYLAPVVNINGHYVGIDKIDHMFQQGYQYFQIWSQTVQRFSGTAGAAGAAGAAARASQAGEAFAQGWGEWVEGHLSAATRANPAVMAWLNSGMTGTNLPASITRAGQGSFGLAATGVHSRGDLAANAAGMRFYRDLFNDFTNGGAARTFDIARYITADWNEEVSGNIFRHDIGATVAGNNRMNPRDVTLPPPAPAPAATP